MLWFDFILGLNFIFLSFKSLSYITILPKKGNNIYNKDKIEPQHIYCNFHVSE